MNLSILIPTIVGREKVFESLYTLLNKQITDSSLQEYVEIQILKDNKEISIGRKRNDLYSMANGKFSVMIDDDDTVPEGYVKTLNGIIASNPDIDGIGYIEECHINKKVQLANHSDKYSDWKTLNTPDKSGFTHYRTLYHKDPIRTEICNKIGVKDLRWGEDYKFAMDLKNSGLIKSSYDIDQIMYIYRYEHADHNTKYGIK